MDALDAIFTRRSVRHFTLQQVPLEDLEALVRAAMQAPSARNRQPRHYVILTERALLEEITTFHAFSQMLHEASAAIVICGEERSEPKTAYWVQDCSAAMQNLLLAAHARGLGAVWLGVHPNPDREDPLHHMLHLPPEVHPLGIAAIGYPAETPPPADRFDPARIHWNGWQEDK